MSLKLDGERLYRDGYKAYAHPILIVIFIKLKLQYHFGR